MRKQALWAVVPALATLASASVIADVTYYKDVLPILQTHCEGCHGPDRVAPISLSTYRQARLWADEVKQAVLAESMPPRWSEEGARHYFAPTRGRLTARERDTIVRWVDEGAQAGDLRDAPPAYAARQAYSKPPRVPAQDPGLR